jgi:probable HAF family extracellular repeat protein
MFTRRRDGVHNRLTVRRPLARRPALDSLECRVVLSYSITSIANIGSFLNIAPTNGINNVGSVIGDISTSPTSRIISSFVYEHGKIVTIPTAVGDSQPTSINDQGTVLGFVAPLNGATPGARAYAYRFQRGKVRTLANFPASGPFGAMLINNKGTIAGIPATDGDALVMQNGRRFDIGSLSAQGSVLFGINNRGQVVGESPVNIGVFLQRAQHAISWIRGPGLKDLGTLGGANSEADGVNNHGVIVGSSQITGSTDFHPYVYTKGRMLDLGTLGGPNGFAHAINDKGVIVGSADVTASSGTHAFIIQNGKMTDLNSLIPANSGFVLNRGLAINNRGQVVVEAYPTGTTVSSAGVPSGPFYLLLLSPT